MLPDIPDMYARWQDKHEQEEIPDWAPRSILTITEYEEMQLTRYEKKLGRILTYGEALKAVAALRSGAPSNKRFIDRPLDHILF